MTRGLSVISVAVAASAVQQRAGGRGWVGHMVAGAACCSHSQSCGERGRNKAFVAIAHASQPRCCLHTAHVPHQGLLLLACLPAEMPAS